MIERLELAPGYAICRVINGLWQLSRGHRAAPADPESAVRGLLRLVEAGFTTFDCADIYLGVEELLGQLVRELEGSSLDPASIQIHTKYVPDRSTLGSLTRDDVEAAIDESLARLDVERLDLVQMHWWDYDQPGCLDVAGWLTDLIDRGKIRHLGTTNFDTPHLAELTAAGIPIVSNQAQCSLLDRRTERAFSGLCLEHGIRILGYGALAGGFLTDTYQRSPEPEAPFANRSLTKYRLIIDEFGGWALHQELLGTLAEVADKHRSTIAAVAARWVLDRDAVGAVMIGVGTAPRIESNLKIFDLGLDDEDSKKIDTILRKAAGPRGEVFELERVPDGPHARIMWTDLNKDRR